jgi:signal transduction histidine kinase
MKTQNSTLLLVTRDENLGKAFRQEFESGGGSVRILVAATPEEARRQAWDTDPALILLEETGFAPAEENGSPEPQRFEAAVALLAGIAPVVVLAAPEHQGEIAPLLAAGAADFVARAGDFFPCAVAMVQRRIQQKENESAAQDLIGRVRSEALEEDFGELLRHELNNPLTGILGNAELLLAEVRRRQDGLLPAGAQQRLETITELAVRLRETVRRLSQHWAEKYPTSAPRREGYGLFSTLPRP